MNNKSIMSLLFYYVLVSLFFSCSSNLEELVIKDKATSEKNKNQRIGRLFLNF